MSSTALVICAIVLGLTVCVVVMAIAGAGDSASVIVFFAMIFGLATAIGFKSRWR